jgi:MFS family permease
MKKNFLGFLNIYPFQFRLMFWGMLISTIGSSMIWPFLMIYIKARLNLPLTTIASLFTVSATAALITAFIAGPITDRFGRKWILVISLACHGLIYIFLSQANTLPAFIILMALTGIINPLYRVGGDAMVADLIPPEQRPDAYAILRLSNNLGISLGPMIGGLLITLSYTTAFIFAAIGMIIYSLLLTVFAIETLPGKGESKASAREMLSGYLHIVKDRPFILFCLVFTLVQMCAVLIWIIMPVYANNVFHIPENRYSLIPTTNALMVVLFQVFVTRRSKLFQPMKVMITGAIMYAASVGLVYFAGNLQGFWIVIVVMTIGELLLMPTSSTYVANLAPMHMRGRYMSIYGLTWGLAQGTAPVLGGFLSDQISPRATWVGGLMIGVIATVGFAFLSRRSVPEQLPIVQE